MKNDLLHTGAAVVAVSKNRTKEDIARLYAKGFRLFGENRIQELLLKVDLDLPIAWHMIGHLQTNKVRDAVRHCDMIQSVDSKRLLIEINKQAAKQGKIMDVLLQVNIAQESTKYGLTEAETIPLIKQSSDLDHVRICGIMVIGPNTKDESLIRAVFEKGKQLYDQLFALDQANCKPCYLSMGMSNDYAIALQCGSNMLRIGTLLFTESSL